ncbi:MAG: TIGR03067 domain-containing protein [Betaproteobacteria bacterium]|nr:TIGR03067 domain-containing protein [Betaproteobacteria bacterium]
MKRILTIFLFAFLTACGTDSGLRTVEPVIDSDLSGTWLLRRAELGGKVVPMPGFEVQIAGDRYRAGAGSLNDRGRLVLFGDELAGQHKRIDVVGEDGPNKGKRYPAIYRLTANGRELEICYDLSQQDRPANFVSPEGSQVLRVNYSKK